MQLGTQEEARPSIPRPIKSFKKLLVHLAQAGETCAAFTRHFAVISSASLPPVRDWVMTFCLMRSWSHSGCMNSACIGAIAFCIFVDISSCSSADGFLTSCGLSLEFSMNFGIMMESMLCSTVGRSWEMWLQELLKSLGQLQPAATGLPESSSPCMKPIPPAPAPFSSFITPLIISAAASAWAAELAAPSRTWTSAAASRRPRSSQAPCGSRSSSSEVAKERPGGQAAMTVRYGMKGVPCAA
mmetsp:Transcript_105762/g.309383  ORF Transcript_105762/g.309383 Transcript_105762/m.309383 type:complete len:242 (+) Transcript_105762:314-1039(+)